MLSVAEVVYTKIVFSRIENTMYTKKNILRTKKETPTGDNFFLTSLDFL